MQSPDGTAPASSPNGDSWPANVSVASNRSQTLASHVERALSSHGVIQPTPFPTLVDENAPVRLDTRWPLEMVPEGSSGDDITGTLLPAQLLLAWALVVRTHAAADSVVVFGANVQGTFQPLVVEVDTQMPIASHLDAIRSQLDDFATANVAVSRNAHSPFRFPSALLYSQDISLAEQQSQLAEDGGVPLAILCSGQQGRLTADLVADSSVVDQHLLPCIVAQFERAFKQLRSSTSKDKLLCISLTDPQDLDKARMLAGRVPAPASICLHRLIIERAQSQPDAEASVSWDTSLTYAELDRYSDVLASRLVSLGLEVGQIVATCFDKSGWVSVVYLAVLKAGGAFAPLNSALSAEQLAPIVGKLNPFIILASPRHHDKCAGLAAHLLDVQTVDNDTANASDLSKVVVTANHPACVVSTSGNSGTTKQLIFDHEAVCSSVAANRDAHDFSPATRTLQLYPYDHHLSIAEMLFTLAEGGCICTPSEDERLTDMAAACRRMKPTLTCLTPSVADMLEPDDLASIETIILSGESMTSSNVRKWASRVNLVNGYGPAEAFGFACSTAPISAVAAPDNFGWPRGCAVWLMDPDDPTRLAPIGAAGELLLESPSIGQAYRADDEASDAAFIRRPVCLPPPPFSQSPGSQQRCLLTGDLVRFDLGDGTLKFIRRKGSQGQLLQSSTAVEELIRQSSSTVRQVTVAVPGRGVCANRPVALISIEGESRTGKLGLLSSAKQQPLSGTLAAIRDHVSSQLPPHLAPSVWFAVTEIPMTPWGKLDIPAVLVWLEAMGRDDFQKGLGDGLVSASDVGNSLATSTPITEHGSVLSAGMAQSFTQTSLPASITSASPEVGGDRFSLLRLAPEKLSELEALLDTLCPDTSSVEDCYPCSSTQEGILVSQVKAPGTYNILVVWDLVIPADASVSGAVTLKSLQGAWTRVVERHAALRTTFVESLRDGGLFDQVVLSTPAVEVVEVPWLEEAGGADNLLQLTAGSWKSGKPQHRLGLCKAADGRLRCQLLVSHSVIDGLSVPSLRRDLERALNGTLGDGPRPDFQSRYIRQLRRASKDEGREFWRSHLDGLSGCLLPKLTDWAPSPSVARVSVMRRSLPRAQQLRRFCQEHGVTLFNVLQAAWALVLRAYTLSDDVCFAFMATDRHLLGDEAEDAVGFFINLILCRVALQGSTPIVDVLKRLQHDFVSGLPHQHVSLAEIAHEHNIPANQLFNTAMTFHAVDKSEESRRSDGVQLRQVDLQDVAEVCLRLQPPPLNPLSPLIPQRLDTDGFLKQYDAVVKIHESDDHDITVQLCYRSTALSDAQAENVFGAFLAAVGSIPEASMVDEVELLDERMRRQILQWNQLQPQEVDVCIHRLIEQTAEEDPAALAIDGHDGSFTYGDLDRMASQLAAHLVGLNVGPEVPVVFRIDKSAWAVVAMLAILKAGGMFVPIDPAWPIDRAQFLVDDVGAQILLTSESTTSLPLERLSHSLVLSSRLIDNLPVPAPAISSPPQVHSRNAAYILYTSGSTGKPKGVVVEHRAVSSSSRAHAQAMGIDRQSRVLQFSSYAFDACICEILTTLVSGGCICIPSEHDRLSNLTGAIAKLRPTWTFMTPTTLRTLRPQDCPSLKTVCIGGEALTQAVKDTWSPYVRVLNGYGPTETCVFAVTIDSTDPAVPPPVVGHPIGSRGWIVRPGNPQKLTPVGAVGELLIEGPIVAREYFKDPVRTNSVFLDQAPPSWTVKSPYRVYCTGDLVRNNADGSITYVGRNDGQVKVRGQRTELGEIEQHLVAIESDIASCIVLLPKTGPCAARLVAAISFNMAYPPLDPVATDGIRLLDPNRISGVLTSLREKLAQRVPVYMVPQIWLPVVALPSTTACKIDRHRVARWVEQLNPDVLNKAFSLSPVKSSFPTATDLVQTVIATAWGHTLDITVDQIPTDRSFFSLGGDSILAMMVINQCRARGVKISASDILRGHTVADLASRASLADETLEQPVSRFDLTSAQSLALGVGLELPSTPPRDSRTVRLRLGRSVTQEALEDAIRNLVALHPALRTTFVNEGTAWHQSAIFDPAKAFLLTVHDESAGTSRQAPSLLEKSRAQLDLAAGPLLTVDYFPDTSLLVLAAPHITLDLPSWSVVLGDLDGFLSGSNASPAVPLAPFTSGRLPQSPLPVKDALGEQGQESNIGYWELEPEDTYLPREMKYELRVESETSEMLLQICQNTDLSPVDLVVAAAAQSFSDVFLDRSVPVIHLVDTTHEHAVIGYHDTVYPVQVSCSSPSTSNPDLVAQARISRVGVASKGLPYMARSYRPQVLATRIPEIIVSYSDYRESKFHGKALQQMDDGVPTAKLSASASLVPSCISITASAQDDNPLSVVVAHSWDLGQQKKVRKWVRHLETALGDFIRSTARANAPLSPTDFPFVRVADDNAWERLRDTIAATIGSCSAQTVEDLYPCSPVQEGILLSQAKSMSSYQVDVVWKIHAATPASAVSLAKIEKAWQAVIRQHAALRTVFVDGAAANEAFLAVVLRRPPVLVQQRRLTGGQGVEALLASEPPLAVADHEPPHRLTIAATSGQDEVLVHLRISHAVLDGVSLDALQHDLARVYAAEDASSPAVDNGRQPSDTAFRDYVNFIRSQDTDVSLGFWKNRLATVMPCHFPRLQVPDTDIVDEKRVLRTELDDISPLTRLCQEHGFTISNLVQIAWALLLRSYTNNPHVCFGYMTSGRDAPVQGIESAVGVFINLLVSNVELDDNTTVRQALEDARGALADGLEHQYCPLVKIQSALQLGSEPLFNTVLSCYRENEVSSPLSAADVAVDTVYLDDTSEFSLAAKATYTRSKIELTLTYWTGTLSPTAADVVGTVWAQTLKSLPSLLDEKVSNVSLFDKQSSRLVQDWNSHVPDAVDACLHDIISRVAVLQPEKEALCSTEGSLTYGQLDDYSTRLGHHLVSLGVGPESVVALLFEKSIWAVVGMLGVLKAGGAFVALDPAHPPDRLALIILDIDSPILLVSETQAAQPLVTEQLASAAVQPWTVTPTSIQALPIRDGKPCSTVTPDNAAYLIFTSGSTGRPKGVVIEHRAVSTGTKEHGSQMAYTPASRVLQFASYAFDATIGEVFTTLVHHGCVCVASETERIEDLPGFMNRFRVTWAFLTPAVARMMTADDVPTLKTLICGGEPIGNLTPRIWSGKVQFIQAYGPTETCVFASISDRQHREVRPAIVGHMMGSAAWIVNPSNADILMPVGAVGEMLIEGPILGRGYRNDVEKTDACFLQSPRWSDDHLQHERPRRFYKTGDLVRYNLDGSMDFIQRKDTQIKVRGQRVEAGEIESHITSAHENVQHVYVTFTKQGRLSSRLISVLSFRGIGSAPVSGSSPAEGYTLRLVHGEDREKARKLLRAITEHLSAKLPRHMVPTVWAVVEGSSVPLTTSGKIDRRQMTAWLERADEDTVQEILALDEDEVVPDEAVSAVEAAVRSIWALVLNLEPEKIGLHRPFFSLGGDSISAMQVVSHCRVQGIDLTVQDMFRCKTIAALVALVNDAAAAGSGTASGAQQLDLAERPEDFALSPIQRMHFDMNPEGVNYFNQSFLVQIPSARQLASIAVQAALHQLVRRHSMLRARFRRAQGLWTQRITDDVPGSLTYQEHSHVAPEEVDALLQDAQESLDIQNGPILAVKLIQLPDRQLLFMVAHHLVVDLVSWRVLLEELEAILTGMFHSHRMAAVMPVPFQAWIRLQATRVQLRSPAEVLPYEVPAPQLDYWGFGAEEANLFGSTRDATFALDEVTTRALLGPCNEPLQTDPQDLFLAAAFQSFHDVFPDRPQPAIFTEGHGREADAADHIDLSRTVAWFTSIVPVALVDGVQPDLIETLKRTKDARRAVPGMGVPYFSYRHLSDDGAERFGHHAQMEILFNYFGQYQQLEREGALLQPVPEGQFAQRDIDPSAPRLAVFDIAVAVAEGRTTISLTIPQSLSAALAHRVSVWTERFQQLLVSLIDKTSRMASDFSLSDMPLIKDISYAHLVEMESLCREHTGTWGPKTIEEILPCSPMQQGILLSQSRTPELYDVRIALEITTSEGAFPKVHRLRDAWKQVVRRQPMLRTVFLPNLRGSGSFDQAVLRDPLPAVREIQLQGSLASSDKDLVERVRQEMAAAPANSFEYGKLAHELVIYTAGERVFVLIRLSHALVDGASLPLVTLELRQAYARRLAAGPGRAYRELVAFLQRQPRDETLRYWREYLLNASPCRLPPLNDGVVSSPDSLQTREVVVPNAESLRRLCSQHGFTMANLMHAAWAIVLRAYTGEDEVCFGYLVSGRDAPIEGVDELLGPLINMLICRVAFHDPGRSVLQLLHGMRDDFVSGLSHQYVSLAEAQHGLNLGSERLFSSVISFQRHDPVADGPGPGPTDGAGSLRMTSIDARDPTEYDLSLNIIDAEQELSIAFAHWTSKVSTAHAAHMMRALLAALAGFAQDPHQPATRVDLVDAETRRELNTWNAAAIPAPRLACLHGLIEQRVQEMPDHPAVSAWDLDFTYAELDGAANAFAHHLQSLGVITPETFILTCFDKSAWVVVAQLAVLKSGGAFAAVDPSHPIDRIRSIAAKLGSPPVMLTSAKYKERFLGLFPHVVLVDALHLESLGPRPIAPQTRVTPENAAYAIFTSGSTGEPKGILIEHQAIATATTVHADRFRLGPDSRVLQFAAYTFDVAVGEIFHTLVNGGCICVPSERQRLEDLPGAINEFGANWMFLTPTLADMLEPAAVPGLQVLVLGGEAATADNVRRWSEKLQLIISYGPAECTIWSNANASVTPTTDPANFGLAFGAGVWVADMDNPDVLLPVGAVGELLIEGPLVGRGYISDAENTAASFIKPPGWLQAGSGGQRIYRSGDIVRYNPDGTLSFVRRRDNQVKVRGQRIELNEVEIHVSQADADLLHAVVLLPKSGACQGRLTAVLSHRHEDEDGQDAEATAQRPLAAISNNEAAMARNAAIRAYLTSRLPGYMVPKIWIAVEHIPVTTNGKIDRRQMLSWVQSLTDNDLAGIVGQASGASTTSPTSTLTPMEKQLVGVWSQVLAVPVPSLPLGQSFTSLGGDSISAMQVVSRARESGVVVTVHDVLRCHSLSGLALRARFKTLAPQNKGRDSLAVVGEEPFPLLPIQRMFFEKMPSGQSHYNQTFTVRLSKRFAAQDIDEAIAAVVRQHPMLRARFRFLQDDDSNCSWTQQISRDVRGSFRFQSRSFSCLADALAMINESQASLDTRQGPLVTATLLDLPDGQVLFLAAHHLVIDLVSWRIILADLELLLSAGPASYASALAPEAVSVPAWSEALVQQSAEYRVDSVLPFAVPPADFTYWDMEGRQNVMADAATIQVRLDASSTKALLGPANVSFGTDPVDLMVAALAFSFCQVFSDRSVPTVYTESHGRNAWDDSIDLSRTVGWFTTIYPLVVPHHDAAAAPDLVQMVRQVKDMRRSIPGKGLPYFASRYLTEEGHLAFQEHAAMEILFNYLGQYQQLQQSDKIIQELADASVDTEDAPSTTPRLALLDVVAVVESSELVLSLGYNGNMQHRDRFQAWLDGFLGALQSLSAELPAMPATFTPGDFPLLGLDEDGLLSFADAVEAKVGVWGPAVVESAYPCSPLQQGILVSQSKDPSAYVVQGVWKICPAEGHPFRVEQLEEAWHRLVRYHPMLRTIFCESSRADGILAQVVLRDDVAAAAPTIQKVLDYGGSDPVQFLRSSPPPLPLDKAPVVLSIYTMTPGGDAYVSLQVSHALIDGTSLGVLMGDLQKAYHGELHGSGPAYGDYISHVYRKPLAQSLAYWSDVLVDTRPCLFPDLSAVPCVRELNKITRVVPNVDGMRLLCRTHGVSISNLFQLAWALVLRAFTGSDDICFGYLTSGRDVPVDRIEEVVGPLISMLICHTNFGAGDDAQSALSLLHDIRRGYVDSLPHQHCSLADIQHALGVGNTGLFNTVISLQKTTAEEETREQLWFETLEGHDPSEV